MQPFEPEDIYRYRTLQGLDGSARYDHAVVLVGRAVRGKDQYQSVAWQLSCAEHPRGASPPRSSPRDRRR